jgi:two-component sensor histidine kinase
VAALAQVHDLLHVTGISSRLDVPAFLARLIANPALVPPERGIRVTCHADPLEVGLEQAAPLALIVTELLTNALKHAFPDARTGTIALTLRTQGANAVLRVSDDGVGLASPKPAARRSGLRLAERLAQQLDGTLTIEPGPGTSFRLEFPVQPASAGNVPGG